MPATLAPPAPTTPPPVQAPARFDDLFRITVPQYQQMIDAGILGEDDRVELLDGLLVSKMPSNPPHESAVRKLIARIVRLTPTGWTFGCQAAITLSNGRPEPDGWLARGNESDYDERHPRPADLGWVAEVSHSSYSRDRGQKYADYAAAGIPVYWIVDVENKRVEVYTDPNREEGKYRTAHTFVPGDAVPVELDGVTVGSVPTAELFA